MSPVAHPPSTRATAANPILAQLTSYGALPKPDPDDVRTEALARRAQAGDYDEEVILEQLARNRAFLKPEGLEKLRNAFVVVVGCGGVGSHCAAALARSGVSALRLVDFDQVSLSSLNRHAVATLQDVGSPKVLVLQRRLQAVAPWVRFELRREKFDDRNAGRLLAPSAGGRRPDYIVDAIDNIDTKVQLLQYCHDGGLPVVSAMGAGTKGDPTKIMVGDISASSEDALSRATRRRLKLLGITSGIPVVFSTERTGEGKAELLPLPEEQFQKGKEAVRELGVIQDFRVRILPVLGTMPAVFGYTAANHVILSLTGGHAPPLSEYQRYPAADSVTGYPLDYVSGKGREKLYDQVLGAIQGAEERIVRRRHMGDPDAAKGLKIPLTHSDVAFLLEDIYRGKSAVTGIPTRPTLVRWRLPAEDTMLRIGAGADEQKSARLRLSELVCMTKEEALQHQNEILLGTSTPEDLYDDEVRSRIEARLAEARRWEEYR